MSQAHAISPQDKRTIMFLLQNAPEDTCLASELDGLMVEELDDGGMGSKKLIPKGELSADRAFGKQLVLGEFIDSDNVPVSVAINIDGDNNLYELDVWKVDFSPVKSWPEPSAIRIVH